MTFFKIHSSGNDFVVVDSRREGWGELNPARIAALCDRRKGIGADGLLALDDHQAGNLKIRYFNADGFPGELCGNGAMCAVWMARYLGMSNENQLNLQVWERSYRAGFGDNPRACWIELGGEESLPEEVLRELADKGFGRMAFFEVGVPHLVVEMTAELSGLDIQKWGPFFRRFKGFPKGANVNFVRRGSGNTLQVRVYERGVEAETQACGTGAVSSAFFGRRFYGLEGRVQVQSPGGILQVDLDQNQALRGRLHGEVTLVFRGELI